MSCPADSGNLTNGSTSLSTNGSNESSYQDGLLVSFVTPAYNEARNLPLLYEQLISVTQSLDLNWEWVVVDDHSTDETFQILTRLAQTNARVHGIRLARNSGSHAAIACGLFNVKGDCAIVLAGDLQDPPAIFSALLAEWQDGAQIVWAVRNARPQESFTNLGFSRLYYILMRHVIGMKDIPATGADCFLVDRQVITALQEFRERNVNLIALLSWMGFEQSQIFYDKLIRKHGRSGWNLEKKLKLVADSFTSFTYLPIRLMSYVGFFIAILGFIWAVFIVVDSLTHFTVPGWPSIMVVMLVLGGVQMMMMGVLGEYLWRALDESRSRPLYLIEMTTLKSRQKTRQINQNSSNSKKL